MQASSVPAYIPSSEDLDKTRRDLRFHPSITTNPKTLSAEQIMAFNRDIGGRDFS
jgi:hypothetical protein